MPIRKLTLTHTHKYQVFDTPESLAVPCIWLATVIRGIPDLPTRHYLSSNVVPFCHEQELISCCRPRSARLKLKFPNGSKNISNNMEAMNYR
ncbi:putative F-box protein [Dirofilaria immitis]